MNAPLDNSEAKEHLLGRIKGKQANIAIASCHLISESG